jgi:hypothetical protein
LTVPFNVAPVPVIALAAPVVASGAAAAVVNVCTAPLFVPNPLLATTR